MGPPWRSRLTLCCMALAVAGPVSAAQWERAYSGSQQAQARAVEATPDGGYILAGYTRSFGAGAADAWLLKLDANGNLVWQKTYGGSSDDYAYSVQPTSDGGYIVAGSSISLGGGLAEYAWLFKVDANGNVVWQKRYGNGAFDRAAFVRQTSDGGYIVAADTQSFQPGATDVWVLRLDAGGGIVWQKKYGGANDEFARTVQPTSDGGYIVAGYTISFGAGGPDAWLLKLDASGNVTWQKTYGGAGSDVAQSAHPTADGGYIVAGSTTSFGAGGNDLWVLKVDASGNIVWQRTYGGAGEDGATAVQPTSDGGYIVAGATQSFGTLDELNAWLLKLDSTGTVVWQRTFAGAGAVAAHAVQPTSDGGYVMAGRLGGVVDAVHAWVAKVDADGLIHGCSGIGTSTASAADGSATSANSPAIGAATDAPSAIVSIIPKISTAVPLQQCSFGTAAISVPAVSLKMLALLAGLVAAGAAFVLRRHESI